MPAWVFVELNDVKFLLMLKIKKDYDMSMITIVLIYMKTIFVVDNILLLISDLCNSM